MSEAGVPSFDVTSWFGIAAPAKIPPEVAQLLNSEIIRVLQDPAIQAEMLKQGAEPASLSPEEFKTMMEKEMVQWADLIHSIGLKVEDAQ